MRIVSRIPHPHFQITVFQFNDHYILKIQLGDFELSLRFRIEDLEDPERCAEFFEDPQNLEIIKKNFLALREIQDGFLRRIQG